MAKCLRCGAGSEWIEGRVRDEPAEDHDALLRERDARIAELEREKAAAIGLQQGTAAVVAQLEQSLAAMREQALIVKRAVSDLAEQISNRTYRAEELKQPNAWDGMDDCMRNGDMASLFEVLDSMTEEPAK